MTLSEQMDSMMNEMRAIKHLNKSIKSELDEEYSLRGIKKVATLIGMIDNLRIPDIVCSFEEVESMDLLDNSQSGMA